MDSITLVNVLFSLENLCGSSIIRTVFISFKASSGQVYPEILFS